MLYLTEQLMTPMDSLYDFYDAEEEAQVIALPSIGKFHVI